MNFICLFQISLVDRTLTELSNAGASGSVFYLTLDDEFIIKTTQHKEADFLQKLLPGYYMVSILYFFCLETVLEVVFMLKLDKFDSCFNMEKGTLLQPKAAMFHGHFFL